MMLTELGEAELLVKSLSDVDPAKSRQLTLII